MPWSTWTTKSPTFRSRRSERNALVAERAALGRAALFLEDVGFGVDLQAGVGQPEAARQRADRHEHGGIARVLGALDRNREDVVFLEQLDRSARRGPRVAATNERRLALVAKPTDLRDPVGDAALQLDRRLTSHVLHRQRRVGCRSLPRSAGASSSSPSFRRPASPARSRSPASGIHEERVRHGNIGVGGVLDGQAIAVLDLLEQRRDVRVHFVPLGHDDLRVFRKRQVVEERSRAVVARGCRATGRSIPDRSRRSTAACDGSQVRSDSMVSPMNSRRTGWVAAAGNTSTMPPRTANSPCWSAGSSRENPASTSRLARSAGSMS